MQCSECGATPAKWVSFNVGEDAQRVCLCERCITELVQLGTAVKPTTPPN